MDASIEFQCPNKYTQAMRKVAPPVQFKTVAAKISNKNKVKNKKLYAQNLSYWKTPGAKKAQKNRGKNPKKNFARSFATPTCELVTSSQNYKCTSSSSERKLDPLIEPPGGAKKKC